MRMQLGIGRYVPAASSPPVLERLPAVLSQLLVQMPAHILHKVGPQGKLRALAVLGVPGGQFRGSLPPPLLLLPAFERQGIPTTTV